MALEAALWVPFLVLLVVGMVQFGKITYLYYTLKKTVYSAARYLSVQQGTNFCDLTGDANVTAAINFALTNSVDSTGTPLIPNLTSDMLQVTTQCIDPATGVPGTCDVGGCPTIAQRPDYIMVSIPNGYLVQPRIPFITLEPVALRPAVLVAFGGTT
jgi:hypothetical protein